MQTARMSRIEQVERNRGQLLVAARRVFLERGFHAASLDAIAEAAGFSKGVVYSQFASKADLFLALLEQRIDERAAENERVAARSKGRTGLLALLAAAERSDAAEPGWSMLLIEFRIHAAREPALNERYARLHARTVERLAATLGVVTGRGEQAGVAEAEAMALFMLAMSAGLVLERAAVPRGLPADALNAMVSRAFGVDGVDAGAVPATAKPAARRRTTTSRRDAGRGRSVS